MKESDIEVLDIDFDQAASYHASGMFGRDKASTKKELIRKYEEEEYLDPLVWILAKHRSMNPAPIPPDMITIPRVPTDAMWDGLPRAIMGWLDFGDHRTGKSLFDHLRDLKIEVPQWLKDEFEPYGMNKTPSKGTRAVILYRAMVHEFENSKLKDPPLAEGFKPLSELVTALLDQMDPAEKKAIETDILKTGTVVKLVKVKCTCLSELGHDAYGPGGPCSGQPLPVCEIHHRSLKA